ncbi:MAG TPA: transcriptional regulator [Stellaceae bacterium]|nr:transcriptional regulator [Stellaceae bacterium]
MGSTREFKETVIERVRRDSEFAEALLDKAATLFLNGQPYLARLMLRDLVNAIVGFAGSAAETTKPVKSLHCMLSEKGDPDMGNLAAVFAAIRKRFGVELEAHAVAAG